MPGTYLAQNENVTKVQKKLKREIEKLRLEETKIQDKLMVQGKEDELISIKNREKDNMMDNKKINI
jgi:hypothetical protein